MTVFDANAVLRFILQDNTEMALLVKEQIENNLCTVPTEVAAEVVYVLHKVYKVPRKEIATALSEFLQLDSISTMAAAVLDVGLAMFAETKLDFVDCLMIGYKKAGYAVFTFDKDLLKALKAYEPIAQHKNLHPPLG
jgi:predicted nucleic-acid-binding protein